MKRKYSKPIADKVEFDYKESVVACSDWGFCWWNWGGCGPQQQQTQTPQQTQAPTNPPQTGGGGTSASNPYWSCGSKDYWGC